ncbi:MAG: DUF1549 domain-containing protein [Verrucomicrobiales bacterium]|nr:DUF1549 domain-containing protein [Verrucomicrobiales bacterium]
MKVADSVLALGLAISLGPAFAAEPPGVGEIPWSFQPLKRPVVDSSKYQHWALNDLDRFIAARLETEDLRPNGNADRTTLIRRAALDLTGLPPTPEEFDRFLRDPAPDQEAFAKVIDAYLASPRFGERWGRHWLDVARYADSVGRTWNAPFVYAWRYRDWVIDAFNNDKSYQRFIAEQIAGDLLPAKSVAQRREQVIATGFLTLGSIAINMGVNEGFVLDQVDDQIDVTTRGFLGLSIACARCHDHKYDPVSQMDYYAMAGIFYSSWTYSGTPHVSDHAGYGYVDPEMLVRLPKDLTSKVDRVREVPGGIHSMSDLRQFGGKAPPPFEIMPDWAMGVRDGKPVNCELRIGGEYWDRDVAPPRGDIRIPGLPDFPDIPADRSGRLELAEWIGSPTHPLTARVAVNRIWQHLFGRGLVETVDNFGFTGREPSHPDLLDHLAIRFVENGWSTKKLIREIMLSHTYQLSGDAQKTAAIEIDPDNTLYWRANARRLELEPIRDSILFIAGDLNNGAPEPGYVAGNGNRGRSAVRGEIGFDSPWRTIYLPVLRDRLPDEFGTFDFPDPSSVAGLRHVTTAPPQSLFFMNSRFVEDAAYRTADRILTETKSDEAGIELAYKLILCREATSDEIADAESFMRGLDVAGLKDPEGYRWATLIQGLFSTAEFRYVL